MLLSIAVIILAIFCLVKFNKQSELIKRIEYLEDEIYYPCCGESKIKDISDSNELLLEHLGLETYIVKEELKIRNIKK